MRSLCLVTFHLSQPVNYWASVENHMMNMNNAACAPWLVEPDLNEFSSASTLFLRPSQ
jgi:hypothetical protein